MGEPSGRPDGQGHGQFPPAPRAPGSQPARAAGWRVYADWQAVYRDNVDRVYRLMYAKVGNRPDAEDLTADVFVAALRPLRVSASVPEVRAYLSAAARTALARHWRRALNCPVVTLDEEQPALTPIPPEPGASAARARVQAILGALTERHRRVLELRFLGSCSLKETAAELGVSVANAKVLQHRALRRACEVAEGMDA
ncbi:RNA polymerase sigma factor [Pseudonocardia bannensis]|uniref:RNA polymerase sigma factor n=1 Tax=Pseudonocardia bannensis TaxID=630973 RepID=UPI0028AF35E5|nr:sigma-70 family RNA polymerase sigma factor [Pseudonocardia bannensis]